MSQITAVQSIILWSNARSPSTSAAEEADYFRTGSLKEPIFFIFVCFSSQDFSRQP